MGNRIIKESCRTSDQLNQLSDGAERMFWRLVTVADDFGRFEADPITLKALCFPRMVDTLKTPKVKGWIDEFLAVGLIKLYQVNGKTYGFFHTWEKHQRRRAQFSKHPAPNADNICRQMTADGGHLTTNAPEDTRIRGIEDTRTAQAEQDGFVQFWTSYPKKKAKEDAEKAWRKIHPDEKLLEKILYAVEREKKTAEWIKDKGQFIPYPATWLNGERWKDEPVVMLSAGAKPYAPRPNPALDELNELRRQRDQQTKHEVKA